MSRPDASVPNQCSSDGGFKGVSISVSYGVPLVNTPGATAQANISAR